MQLAHPEYLWLFLLLVPLIAWYVWKYRNAYPALEISTTTPYNKLPRSIKEYMLHGLFLLRLAAISCVIIVLARPQTRDSWRTSSTEGTDIIIALDISTSMLARDFRPDRFEAAKDVAAKFVAGRESDNIGVVIFAGESFTAVPMTTDRSVLANYIHDIKMGMLEDGTAIGDGLATSINRIKDGKAKSNTIGVGRNGTAPMPQQNYFGGIDYVNMPVVIDENTLRTIASTTGGKYFRATGNNVLKDIFAEIDQLEKTQMDVRHFSHTEDNYMMWAWLAIGLFLLEILLRHTVLRTIP